MKAFKNKKISLLLTCIACVLFLSCARERARTDITLEMTDEDSVEAIIDQDLLTAGGTIVNLEEPETAASPSTVTYVDEVEMQKPVLVKEDKSLKPEEDIQAPPEEETKTVASVSEPLETPGEGLIEIEEPKVIPKEKTEKTETIAASEEPISTEELIEENKKMLENEGLTQEIVETSSDEIVLPGESGTEEVAKVTEEVGTEEITFPDESVPVTKKDIQPAVVRPPGGGYYTKYTPLEKIPVYPRHTVKRGDTLWSVSKKYGCSISELVAANNISRRSVLRIGQILIVPVAKKKAEDSAEQTSGGESGTEKVASESPTIKPTAGSEVKTESSIGVKPAVQAPQVETEIYTVKKGDSYWKIARKYGVTSAELMALNNTSSTLIKVGQKILVPKK